MSHTNDLISFLRHYGPISASDNMYDELIQTQIKQHSIDPPINIKPTRLSEVQENFESPSPHNIILTGTAGDGKTYYCRLIWEHFGGDADEWQQGKKIVDLDLSKTSQSKASQSLTIVKDLSELTSNEKDDLMPRLASAITGNNKESVFLVAANDGQLLATWRDWADDQGEREKKIFKIVENMLVEEHTRDKNKKLSLDLYNLSRLDASEHFQQIMEQIVEHPQWSQCQGCELLNEDNTTICPIRINRERLRGGEQNSIFRKRLGELLKLASANRMHLPIRDLLLLGVNIILGDRHHQVKRTLLTCRTAKNRAEEKAYRLTHPYANVFGSNLPERQRQQYRVFTTLEGFGIGRETANNFDDLLIYGSYEDSDRYQSLVADDIQYGSSSYKPFLVDYLEGEREEIDEFMCALARQRQRLFFSLPEEEKFDQFDPWRLTVYQSSGTFLNFIACLKDGTSVSAIVSSLVRGLNRTFCGMMIDEDSKLYFASSGGDSRGRTSFLLNHVLSINPDRRNPYACFDLPEDGSTPHLSIIDPEKKDKGILDSFDLQLTHFEYLFRVANGSFPASFSRQCYEDFLDFKLRVIKRLDDLDGKSSSSNEEISLRVLEVDEQGRVQTDDIQIRVGA